MLSLLLAAMHAENIFFLVSNNHGFHVGLTESGNVQCRKYSGGMKRRLSAAMVRYKIILSYF
jgi:ABC-type nitrate/sulfonate/bicarbonate transport system ATPase subunit